MNHDYYKDEECRGHDWLERNIVEGGLSLCKVCGGLEGGLTTDCPGKSMTNTTQDDVYAGRMDFIEGKGWVVGALNPTNKSWLYGSYIKCNGNLIKFAFDNKISIEYLLEIISEWTEKGWIKE